jgi:hypothetical protein
MLGAEFETHCFGNLAWQWSTQDWPTLLVLCHDYFNEVKPNGKSEGVVSKSIQYCWKITVEQQKGS